MTVISWILHIRKTCTAQKIQNQFLRHPYMVNLIKTRSVFSHLKIHSKVQINSSNCIDNILKTKLGQNDRQHTFFFGSFINKCPYAFHA